MRDKDGAGNEGAPTAGRLPRWRLWCAGVCVAIGVLVIPALVALVLVGPVIIRGVREGRARWVLGGSAIALGALISGGVGLCGLSAFCNHARFSWEAAYLASAIIRYQESYGRLPDSLDDLSEAGLYPAPDAAPRGIKTYLPVGGWDGKTRVVIAVVVCKQPLWPKDAYAYILAGDSRAHYVSLPDLDQVLVEDNSVREVLGEARRWPQPHRLLKGQ